MFRHSLLFAGAAALAILSTGALAGEVEEVLGQQEFLSHCAACHGPDGKGGGPFAELMREQPKSLTQIAERNGGMFPVRKIYNIIAGTEGVQAHGTLQMPIWGKRYMADVVSNPDPSNYGPYGSPSHYEEAVRGRILSLIMFLAEIQD